MKNKFKKIILVIIIFIILVIASLALLITNKIIPNPFLDKKDLICIKTTYEVEYESKKIITIKFDKWAKSEKIVLNEEITFYDLKNAQKFFDDLKNSIGKNWKEKIDIKDKKVFIINKSDKLDKEYILSKKQTKIEYEEIGYECE